jgi:alpha-L-rhamnosidase
MNSFNHWAMGAVGEWMWRVIVGINPDDDHPGYKHFTIRPCPGGGLAWAKGQYNSIRGKIVSDWELAGGKFTLHVVIPANATATVCVPATDAARVTESGKPAQRAEGVRFVGQEKDKAIFEVDSGTYSFASDI